MTNFSTSRRTALRNGFMMSVGAAAGLAGANAQAASAQNANAEETFDAIILGAGTAGITAAIEAADRGAKVLLLEKHSRPDGNTLYAIGTVCSYGSKVHKANNGTDSADALFEDMMKISSGRGDRTLTRRYVTDIPGAVDWLINRCGVKFVEKLNNGPWPILQRGLNVQGQGITGGGKLIETLLSVAEKLPIDIRYDHKAVELLQNERAEVTGVRVLTPTGYKNFRAKGGVLIATGGFSANGELVNRYMGGWAARLAVRGSRSTTGENITLTMPLFAKCVSLDQFHCGPIVSATHANPVPIVNAGQGIVVDMRGNRILDESKTYVEKCKILAQQTIENRAFVVCDAATPRLEPLLAKYRRLNTAYAEANDIATLADKAGLPKDALVRAVESFNQAVEAGKARELTPPNSYKKPLPIVKAPFYAIPFEGGITATFGGPLINEAAEIQTLEGRSIPGLYAAGNAAGGLFFDNYIAGSQLGAAVIFGRIAARGMVERARS